MAGPAPLGSPPGREPCGPPCLDEGVDWTRPPYRVGSIVTLLHPGENPAGLSAVERRARLLEYRRQLLAKVGEPYFADSLRRLREVFDVAPENPTA